MEAIRFERSPWMESIRRAAGLAASLVDLLGCLILNVVVYKKNTLLVLFILLGEMRSSGAPQL